MTASNEPTSATGLQVISRSAQILRMLGAGHTTLRLIDVVNELQIGRTTAYRYLQSLANEGLLSAGGDGSYGLGPLVAGLGATMLSEARHIDVASPFLEQLAENTGETSVLGIWTGGSAVAVLCKESPGKPVSMRVRIGAALPADAAQSIVFLANQKSKFAVERSLNDLPTGRSERARLAVEAARLDGFAVSDVVLSGVSAIAAPVFDASGRIAATIALVAPTSNLKTAADGKHVELLLSTSYAISHELGAIEAAPENS